MRAELQKSLSHIVLPRTEIERYRCRNNLTRHERIGANSIVKTTALAVRVPQTSPPSQALHGPTVDNRKDVKLACVPRSDKNQRKQRGGEKRGKLWKRVLKIINEVFRPQHGVAFAIRAVEQAPYSVADNAKRHLE